ncbi:ABC transporter permease [Rhodococcus sp. ABRD24]|uniref:ABC transporter permease subunit n=1 Tax=Rhodococcus sp. ABRD24 TaxID=2507582 RepID=UPI00103C6811|nr:ABC transporter permease subunit [Rhodococcus sp. ABRD24]QBJ94568.1 ABC transporter permease [Rhodococcus sp. ABRD24]
MPDIGFSRAVSTRTVFTKSLWDQRRSLPAWAVGLVLLVAMYVAIWPSVRDQPSISDFVEQMPKAMRALFAMSGADMSTPVGYVQVELLSFMGPLLLLLYAIATGAAAVAGEEEHRTLDLLLSSPIGRSRIFLEKFAAMAVGIALLGAVTGVALVAEGGLVGMNLPAGNVAGTMVHLSLLALVYGTLAATLGALTGHTVISRAVPAVAAVLAYVVNGLGPIVSWLEPWQKFSPFYQYAGHDPLRNGLSAPAVLVSLGTVAVLVAIALPGFRRRDVAG